MIIRKAKLEDDNNLLNMLLSLDKETKYMLLEPNEREHDISRVQGMIQQSVSGPNFLLVAEEEDNIVGFLSAKRGSLKRIKHTAYIVVGIREIHRGKGIGTKFFSELNLWAKENLITRLELTVMCPNVVAKHLYEKNGFEIEGIKKRSMLVDGQYVD
ncbi:GNAT family N-acetyltransferase [Clostridium beijerinckii]|uniref:GNAT family N-acetyltransferase n=1 Tax=Clostridium beijerinckii TaxID=1520 RepID=UPI000479E6D4|nr:GNAT family N-acetyltransferase [Clostridium beijerinckii]